MAQLSALRSEKPQPVLGRCQGMLTIISDDDEHLADWSEYLQQVEAEHASRVVAPEEFDQESPFA